MPGDAKPLTTHAATLPAAPMGHPGLRPAAPALPDHQWLAPKLMMLQRARTHMQADMQPLPGSPMAHAIHGSQHAMPGTPVAEASCRCQGAAARQTPHSDMPPTPTRSAQPANTRKSRHVAVPVMRDRAACALATSPGDHSNKRVTADCLGLQLAGSRVARHSGCEQASPQSSTAAPGQVPQHRSSTHRLAGSSRHWQAGSARCKATTAAGAANVRNY